MKIKNPLPFIFYFFCFCPFVSLGFQLGTDMQLFPLATSMVVIAMNVDVRISKKALVTSVYMATISTIIFLISIMQGLDTYSCLRSLLNYIDFAAIFLASYILFTKQSGLNEKYLRVIIDIWLLVALVQKLVDVNFASGIVSNMRTSASRGVNSLASEPSFYGYMCVFALFCVIMFKERKTVYGALLVFQILFLASSAITVVYLFVMAMAYVIYRLAHPNRGRLKKTLVLSLVAVLGILAILKFAPSMRIGVFIYELTHGSTEWVSSDASVQQRIGAILRSFQLIRDNGLLPSLYLEKRLMSGYGAALAELGIFVIPIIIGFIKYYISGVGGENGWVIAVSVTAMMFSAVQFGIPAFAFMYAFGMWSYERSRVNKVTETPHLKVREGIWRRAARGARTATLGRSSA